MTKKCSLVNFQIMFCGYTLNSSCDELDLVIVEMHWDLDWQYTGEYLHRVTDWNHSGFGHFYGTELSCWETCGSITQTGSILLVRRSLLIRGTQARSLCSNTLTLRSRKACQMISCLPAPLFILIFRFFFGQPTGIYWGRP